MAPPTPPTADRNLLFGILALQMDFIGRDALIAAMNVWAILKSKPLGQILLEQGKLTPEQLHLLEAMVAGHLQAHADDPRRSLGALAAPPLDELRALDEELDASL